MGPNALKRLWAAGGAAVSGWLAIPNSFASDARLMAAKAGEVVGEMRRLERRPAAAEPARGTY